MAEFLQAMALPFLACLLLAGIHVYLGIHVLARKVIFVDLALAQIAALGAVYGVILGFGVEEHPIAAKLFSLAFALAGAFVFSFTRMRHERVPHEAIIGITYAVALASTVLASSHLPHGADELRELLSGSILWVEWPTIVYTAILYGLIGLFHFVFRKQLLAISFDSEQASQNGVNIRFWDFCFYATFAFVVTSSVAIAGVLLVFSYLVIPAVIAVLLAEKLSSRLIIGWSVGGFVSVVGVAASYVWDLPSGPAIVVLFAVSLMGVGAAIAVIRSATPGKSALQLLVLAVVFSGLFIGSWQLRHQRDHDALKMLASANKNERLLALKVLETQKEGSDIAILSSLGVDEEAEVRRGLAHLIATWRGEKFLPLLYTLLLDQDDTVRAEAIKAIKEIQNKGSIPELLAAFKKETDEYLRVEIIETLLELEEKQAISLMIDLMANGSVEQVRQDAYEHLSAHIPVKLHFDAALKPSENRAQIEVFRRWWREQK